jgi:hypothetical protein
VSEGGKKDREKTKTMGKFREREEAFTRGPIRGEGENAGG